MINRRSKRYIIRIIYLLQFASAIYLWSNIDASDLRIALDLLIACVLLIELRPNKRFLKYNRTKQLKKNGGTHTERQWRDLKRHWGNKCACCGMPEHLVPLTKDHIIPVALGGKDTIDNLQPLCQSCNSTKGKTIVRF